MLVDVMNNVYTQTNLIVSTIIFTKLFTILKIEFQIFTVLDYIVVYLRYVMHKKFNGNLQKDVRISIVQ